MRRLFLICGLTSLLLIGCSDSPQPKARRGSPERLGKMEESDNQAPAEENVKYDAAGGEVRVLSLTLTAPAGWLRKKPRSDIVAVEYALPRAEGDDADGRLTLGGTKGTSESNIDRWKGQFGSAPERPAEEKIEMNGLSATMIDLGGEFDDQMGGGNHPGYRMIAAIISSGEKLHFVRAVGPKKTIAAQAEKIKAFIRSAKR